MKKLTLIFILALAFVACKDSKENQTEATIEEKIKSVRLYTLNGGKVRANRLEMFSQDTSYTGQSKVFADAYYIIEHPKGTLMWDAGLPENLVGMSEPFTDPSGAFTISRKDSVINQLAEINMTPKDINWIALSHTHFDHTGHAEQIKTAEWLVQKEEYNFVTSKETQENNADIYNAINDLTRVKKISGDYDVFGDKTVIIKSMPGHTPGHQVLFLKLENAGNIMLSGDLYHFEKNRENRGVPAFNFDTEMTLKSMDAFEAFAKENEAEVYIQHSQIDFDRLPKYPNYLD